MAQQINAVYENGVLRPLKPIALAEHQRVRILIHSVENHSDDLVARQKMAFAKLEAQLSKLPYD